MNVVADSELLSPATVAVLRRLSLRLPGRLRGPGVGIHRSPDHGTGAEFAEHRVYSQGDDLRDLDWRASARGDRVYVKRFTEETNLRSGVFLDVSGSMGFPAGDGGTKLDYARRFAAALVYLLVGQGDPVAVAGYGRDVEGVPASARPGQVARAIRFLSSLAASGDGELKIPSGIVPPGGGVFLLGDFYEEPGALETVLRRLRQQRQRVVVFHVLAESETMLSSGGTRSFRDLESEGEIIIDTASYTATYAAAFSDYLTEFRAVCSNLGVHYVPASTSRTPVEVIASFLAGTV